MQPRWGWCLLIGAPLGVLLGWFLDRLLGPAEPWSPLGETMQELKAKL
jgi:F0F1-type ATP synthase assembly protein I